MLFDDLKIGVPLLKNHAIKIEMKIKQGEDL